MGIFILKKSVMAYNILIQTNGFKNSPGIIIIMDKLFLQDAEHLYSKLFDET